MTDSAKWAWYAPGEPRGRVLFGVARGLHRVGAGGAGDPGHLWDGPRMGRSRSQRTRPRRDEAGRWSRGRRPGRCFCSTTRSRCGEASIPSRWPIIDPHHPSVGEVVTDKVLAMPGAGVEFRPRPCSPRRCGPALVPRQSCSAPPTRSLPSERRWPGSSIGGPARWWWIRGGSPARVRTGHVGVAAPGPVEVAPSRYR